MPTKLRPNQQVSGYEIVRLINAGAFAFSYEAIAPDGQRVFFKQYKSPSVRTPWYRAYVDYQQEIKRRMEAEGGPGSFCYKFLHFFESDDSGQRCFYQVFEFVESGGDLQKFLDILRTRDASAAWMQRLTFARLMMAGIDALHRAQIVHCDLKPENIHLIRDEAIAVGYRLKIIDMDFSILADKPAPWHGDQGYVGSPNYFSPEHLAGQVPVEASDVFTCGLILYELLGEGHPYHAEDEAEFREKVHAYGAAPPRICGPMTPGSGEATAAVLHQCLHPDPAMRPSAEVVHGVLLGKVKEYTPPRPEDKEEARPEEDKKETPEPVAAAASLELTGENGRAMRINIRTGIGKYNGRLFGEDARFLHREQFVLERSEDGAWMVVPNTDAPNDTLLNGKAITEPSRLQEGDVLAVGRESRGIVKLPMKVHIL